MLRSEALQQTLAEAVLQKMQEKGYMGLDVDFEYLGRELAEAYAQFLSRLHGCLRPTACRSSPPLRPKPPPISPAPSTRATTTPLSPPPATQFC